MRRGATHQDGLFVCLFPSLFEDIKVDSVKRFWKNLTMDFIFTLANDKCGYHFMWRRRYPFANKQERLSIAFTASVRREFVPRDQGLLLYTLTTKIGRFTPILSIRIVLSCFYLLVSHFEDFSTWLSGLLFAANAMLNLYRDSRKSKRTFAMFRLRNRLAVATGLVYNALLLVTPIALLTIFLNPQLKGVGDKF